MLNLVMQKLPNSNNLPQLFDYFNINTKNKNMYMVYEVINLFNLAF